jgi:hypothetical protein
MNTKRWRGLFMLLVLTGASGACQQSLFTHSDSYTHSRIDRYWSGDSAVEMRAARGRAADTGFGFPIGMAQQ